MILAAAALVVLLFVAAFIFGFDLTPSDPLPKLQSPMPAPVAAQPQAPVPKPTRAPAPPAAEAFAPPAAHTAKPAPTPTPAVEPAKGEVVKGSVKHQVLPEIPEKIMATIQGHVIVGIRVEVDLEGTVARAYVDSPGPSRFFANQALHAAQSWKFIPAKVGGHASAGTWLLQFQFAQSEITVAPSEVFP
jgi:TonB family protein